MDIEKNTPENIYSKLSEFLENISQSGEIKLTRSSHHSQQDGTGLNIIESVKLSIDDPEFISALIDRINHLMKGQEQIFAVKESSK